MFSRLFGSRPSTVAPTRNARPGSVAASLAAAAARKAYQPGASAAAAAAATKPSPDFTNLYRTNSNIENLAALNNNNNAMSLPLTPNSSISLAPSNTLTAEEDIVIPFYKLMSTDAKAHFKPQVNQIRTLLNEMKQMTSMIENIQTPLKNATKNLQKLKGPNIKNTSFRGASAPTLYVTPTANGRNVEARINFVVNGYPQRASHPSSFDAVLASMKQKTRNLRSKTGPLRNLIADVKRKQSEYNAKQQELTKLVKKLQKDHEEYAAAHAKMVRASRKTYQPGTIPRSLTLATAESALATPAPPSRFSLFGKRGGKIRTSKRSHKRGGKTRKNRK